jgi:hypothetical protein
MPNFKARGKKPPTVLWPVPVETGALWKCIGKPPDRDRRMTSFTIEVIQYDHNAPLEELVTDFRTLISKGREAIRGYVDDGNDMRVERAAKALRGPALKRAAETARRLRLDRERTREYLESVPWPTAAAVARTIGWPTKYVKKILRRVKRQHTAPPQPRRTKAPRPPSRML